jgi:hypothetical protein
MKTRAKNKKEIEYDQQKLDISTKELADIANDFASEFAEFDGDVFYSTYQKLQNAAWTYDQEKESSKMTKVGEVWEWQEGICGEYRYRDI